SSRRRESVARRASARHRAEHDGLAHRSFQAPEAEQAMTSKASARPVAFLATAIVIGLLLSACFTPASTVCDAGRVCPATTRCGTVRRQCILPGCGDGVRSESEKCEGTDLGGETCASLGYHGQTTGLACTEACGFDTSGCTGKCGDGKVYGQPPTDS